ncbi:unnamed protein product, partial [Rotaria magnacalcarata]
MSSFGVLMCRNKYFVNRPFRGTCPAGISIAGIPGAQANAINAPAPCISLKSANLDSSVFSFWTSIWNVV